MKNQIRNRIGMIILLVVLAISCSKHDILDPQQIASSVIIEHATARPMIIYSNERSVKIAQDADFMSLRKTVRVMENNLQAVFYRAQLSNTTAQFNLRMTLWKSGTKLTVAQFDALCRASGFINGYTEFYSWQASQQKYWKALNAKFPSMVDSEWKKSIYLTTQAISTTSVDYSCTADKSVCDLEALNDYHKAIIVCGTAALLGMMASPITSGIIYVACGGGAIQYYSGRMQVCKIKFDDCKDPLHTIAEKPPALTYIVPIQWNLVTIKHREGIL